METATRKVEKTTGSCGTMPISELTFAEVLGADDAADELDKVDIMMGLSEDSWPSSHRFTAEVKRVDWTVAYYDQTAGVTHYVTDLTLLVRNDQLQHDDGQAKEERDWLVGCLFSTKPVDLALFVEQAQGELFA